MDVFQQPPRPGSEILNNQPHTPPWSVRIFTVPFLKTRFTTEIGDRVVKILFLDKSEWE